VTEQDRKTLRAALAALADAKAEEPVVMDLSSLTTMTDFFVVAHGSNNRQVHAMAKRVEESLRTEVGLRPHHVEGLGSAQWVLMDYGFLILHLFLGEKRGYYDLERIWMDAPRVTL
jgi:ribosome-associated protein